MSKIDLNIPTLSNQFVDLRDSLPGDAYNWSWVRGLSSVNYLAIHHTAGPDNQTPGEIANYHINNNGWGGIGYHFLIGKDGSVYYVGDISTARANVANLNDQVIGICLIGNFTGGNLPSSSQLDAAYKLCNFFINNYPDLTNVTNTDAIKGHKELPGQATVCPGDNWEQWKSQIIAGISSAPPTSDTSNRGAQITQLYRDILGRDPDMGGLQTYTNGPLTIEQIAMMMIHSQEHQQLIAQAKQASALQSQVDNLQMSLGSVNQQLITLQETLQEREQEINNLKAAIPNIVPPAPTPKPVLPPAPMPDHTLTITDLLINLYKFIFPPLTSP